MPERPRPRHWLRRAFARRRSQTTLSETRTAPRRPALAAAGRGSRSPRWLPAPSRALRLSAIGSGRRAGRRAPSSSPGELRRPRGREDPTAQRRRRLHERDRLVEVRHGAAELGELGVDVRARREMLSHRALLVALERAAGRMPARDRGRRRRSWRGHPPTSSGSSPANGTRTRRAGRAASPAARGASGS